MGKCIHDRELTAYCWKCFEVDPNIRQISAPMPAEAGKIKGTGRLKNKFRAMSEPVKGISALALAARGGEWLGAARNYLQWNAMNGDNLTWNSDDEVRGLTVRKIEEMASQIAAAAINNPGG